MKTSSAVLLVAITLAPVSKTWALAQGSLTTNTGCSPTGFIQDLSGSGASTIGYYTNGAGQTTYYIGRVQGIYFNGGFSSVASYTQNWQFNPDLTMTISEAVGSPTPTVHAVSGTWHGSITPAFGSYTIRIAFTVPGCIADVLLDGNMSYSGQ
jgi:hypothetical protein